MEHFVWNANPVLLEVGSLQLRWYGLLFIGSFPVGGVILRWIFSREGKSTAGVEPLLVLVLIGALVGARLAHCFLYSPAYYLAHPLEVLYIWQGGLASHGGLVGTVLALVYVSRRYELPLPWLLARVAIPGALTAACVRLGNFFNSEILGLPAQVPWAVVFARVDNIPRHPVQLYESLAYLALFGLLLLIYRKASSTLATRLLPPVFLCGLFSARFVLEYFKTRQADYTTDLPFSTGQMLSLPFMAIGVVWMIWAVRQAKAA
ncbi:prolipoprotein diacylglyceryl transferase [Hydrogenophaga sp. 5NK40-0174]|uniref:prolipoprotein diacylglyceryl transferase n=1 Tax=Hydrogenophaga sp. 5NK40-0174 TaxID=3127649 RepID=UPI0031084745